MQFQTIVIFDIVMNLPIYVINLKSAQKRWELVQASGKGADLTFFRVEAVDGNLIPKDEWMDVDHDEFFLNTARTIFPGEYGCYRSHMLALEMFVASEEKHGIILEDDILPDGEMLKRINNIVSATDGFDVVKLVNHRTSGFITFATTPTGDNIGRALFGPQGSAAAYLVSRVGAMALLKSLRTMSLPWDVALEKYWKTNTNILTLKENILEFSQERSISNIAPNGYGKKKSFGAYLRRGLHIAPDYFRFFHYAALGPRKHIQKAKQHPVDSTSSKIGLILAGLGVLAMLSVFWIETDLYRYACLALVIPSIYFYLRHGFWRYDKPLSGFAGVICYFWGFYVLGRFLHDIIQYPEQGNGSAEGIYLFPAFYPIVGYAIWRFCKKPFPIIVSFIAFSIVALLISTDYASIAAGVRATTFAHNNTIHAANAAGFIFIFAACFAFHNLISGELANGAKVLAICAGVILCAIALVNVLILTSKGVWLALAIVLPFMMFYFTFPGRKTHDWNLVFRSAIVLIFALFLSAAIYWYLEKILISVSDSYNTIWTFLHHLVDGKGLVLSVQNVIDSSVVSSSALARLQIWLDVFVIWSEAPFFGAGVSWEDGWVNRTYSIDYPLNIFHNGFLEIGIRYGLFGLVFYGFVFLWAVRKVYMAARCQIISPVAATCYFSSILFFILSNLTNSNIRLATGESFMLLAIGFGFFCSFRLQEKGIIRPKTWL